MSKVWKLLVGEFMACSAGTTPSVLEGFIEVYPWIQMSLPLVAMAAWRSPDLNFCQWSMRDQCLGEEEAEGPCTENPVLTLVCRQLGRGLEGCGSGAVEVT